MCLKGLEVSARVSLSVGDGGSDELTGAQEVGMNTVLVTHAVRKLWSERLSRSRCYADYEIDTGPNLIV